MTLFLRENEECARNRWACDRVIVSCWSLGRGPLPSGRPWIGGPDCAARRRGVSSNDIAVRVGVSRRGDCLAGPLRDLGVKGLDDEQRPGRPPTVDRAKIIAATLTPPPVKPGVIHWSSRLLADHLKVDASTVLRTWRYHRASGLDGRSFSTPS